MFGFLKNKRPADMRSDELCAALLPLWRTLAETVAELAGRCPARHEAGIYVGSMALVELDGKHGGDIAELRVDFVARWLAHMEMALQDGDGAAAGRFTELMLERYALYKVVSEDIDSPAGQLTMQLFIRCVGGPFEEAPWSALPAVDAVAKLTSEVRARARQAASG